MPASSSHHNVRLLFTAVVVCALAFAFSVGQLIGLWAEKAAKPPIVHSPTKTS